MTQPPLLTLRRPADADEAAIARLHEIARRALDADGQPPFNDQALVDVRTGGRALVIAVDAHGIEAGAAIVGDGELELAILPDRRGTGLGGAFVDLLLADPDLPRVERAWAHGDHPAARRIASTHGFARTRTLLQLRMPLAAADGGTGSAFDVFRPGRDEREWVALNARVFADHPEQGRLTVHDVLAREAEPWFDPGDVIVARDEGGRMIGYNWLKVDGEVGEIYVLGVDDAAAGRGLGRSLMLAGLARLRERGCTVAALYVDEENARAVRLYRSLGFADHTIDVQYSRTTDR